MGWPSVPRPLAVSVVAGLLASVAMVLWATTASSIPAFARRYGLSCSACHTAWPELNAFGEEFKLSGYRRWAGTELTPATPDLIIGPGLTLPAIPPLAIRGATGFDLQHVSRRAADGSTGSQTGTSFDLNTLELMAGAPLGPHLSFFLDVSLFETEIESRTGPGEADDTKARVRFGTEGPQKPEQAKFIWSSLLPQSIGPADSLNLVVGILELPLAFSPEARRLSVAPYLIYKRRALDLLSGTPVDDLLSSDESDRLFRLSENQIGAELNGVLNPGGMGSTPRLEYHFGVTNGSNREADANSSKDLYARVTVRWRGHTLGVFGYWSPDIYDDDLRAAHTLTAGGPFSERNRRNEAYSVGPDLTLNRPLSLPVWLQIQVFLNHESNPTGFDEAFQWWGGFAQLNWTIRPALVAYGRYDWLRGDRFDDTTRGGVTGPGQPREWAATGGLQWYVLDNLKVIGEYSRHEFTSSPGRRLVAEDSFTARVEVAY
jgi:hypothetical protein